VINSLISETENIL